MAFVQRLSQVDNGTARSPVTLCAQRKGWSISAWAKNLMMVLQYRKIIRILLSIQIDFTAHSSFVWLSHLSQNFCQPKELYSEGATMMADGDWSTELMVIVFSAEAAKGHP